MISPIQSLRKVASDAFPMHKRQQISMGNALIGLLQGGVASISSMGRHYAIADNKLETSTMKQMEKLFVNYKMWDGKDPKAMWTRHMLSFAQGKSNVFLNMDWTSMQKDAQKTLMVSLQVKHNRSIPLTWTTLKSSDLKGHQHEAVDLLLRRVAGALPVGTSATIVADREFGVIPIFEIVKAHNLSFVMRIRNNIKITSSTKHSQTAKGWEENGETIALHESCITSKRYAVGMTVVTNKEEMKDTWALVTNRTDLSADAVNDIYTNRWSIESMFRDCKDSKYGFGFNKTVTKSTDRRDALWLIVSMGIFACYTIGIPIDENIVQHESDSFQPLEASSTADATLRVKNKKKVQRRPNNAYSIITIGFLVFKRLFSQHPERCMSQLKVFDDRERLFSTLIK
jgi:Transposase DDE domain